MPRSAPFPALPRLKLKHKGPRHRDRGGILLKVPTQKGEASKPDPPIPPTTHTCYLPRHPDARYPNTGQMLQDSASQQLSIIPCLLLRSRQSLHGTQAALPLPAQHPPSHAQPALQAAQWEGARSNSIAMQTSRPMKFGPNGLTFPSPSRMQTLLFLSMCSKSERLGI